MNKYWKAKEYNLFLKYTFHNYWNFRVEKQIVYRAFRFLIMFLYYVKNEVGDDV